MKLFTGRKMFADNSDDDTGSSDSDTEQPTSSNIPKLPADFQAFSCTPVLTENEDATQDSADFFVLDTGAADESLKEKASKTNATEDKSNNPAGKHKAPKTFEDRQIEAVLAKSLIQPGYEQRYNEGAKSQSKKAIKRHNKAEKEKTKGSSWFGLPATELTEDIKRDLEVIQMRDSLDTKTHYKSNDRPVLPKYFQVGRILEHKADFYNSRVSMKNRKKSIVDELLADANFQRQNKRRYDDIKAKEAMTRRGAFQHK
uniref:Fcf2 pre-rRNA processing C-terminal domain-containing protein n=1 Tax=Plectus sambesii TaxID=2011161 RepID=A0A914XH88_9BILA